VALSGNGGAAIEICYRLHEALPQKPTLADVQVAIDCLPISLLEHADYISALNDGAGVHILKTYRVELMTVGDIEFAVSGSGGASLEHIIRSAAPGHFGGGNGGAVGLADRAGVVLHTMQVLGGSGISDGWGGGFELVTATDGAFAKRGELMMHYVIVQDLPDGRLFFHLLDEHVYLRYRNQHAEFFRATAVGGPYTLNVVPPIIPPPDAYTFPDVDVALGGIRHRAYCGLWVNPDGSTHYSSFMINGENPTLPVSEGPIGPSDLYGWGHAKYLLKLLFGSERHIFMAKVPEHIRNWPVTQV